jgi:tetrahydrodipicolinate N-succinyltransferase
LQQSPPSYPQAAMLLSESQLASPIHRYVQPSSTVGVAVGEGFTVGASVGAIDGVTVGEGVTVGASVGAIDGVTVGEGVGAMYSDGSTQ